MFIKKVKGPIDDNTLNNINHNFGMSDVLRTQINDLILDSGNSDVEVVQARKGHQTLSDRLNETDQRLSETISDSNISINTVWSSQKTKAEIELIPKGAKGDPGTSSVAIDDSKTDSTHTWSSAKIKEGRYEFYCTGKISMKKTVKTGTVNTHKIEIDFGGLLRAVNLNGTTYKTLEKPLPIELSQDQILLWDLTLNTLEVISAQRQHERTNVLLLAHVFYGEIKGGILAGRNIVDSDLYIIPDNIKFNGNISFNKINTDLKVTFDIGDLISTDIYGGVLKRLNIKERRIFEMPQQGSLFWNVIKNTLRMGNRADFTNDDVILLVNDYGHPKAGFLAERYNYETDLMGRKTNVTPTYVDEMIEDTTHRASQLQKEGTFTFGLITDTHTNDRSKHFAKSMGEGSRRTACKYIVHGGDIMDGSSEKSWELKQMSNVISDLSKGGTPVLYCKGNHEDNYLYANTKGRLAKYGITNRELYNRSNKFIKDKVVMGSEEGFYFYKDDEETKIRSIFLNTNDHPYILEEDGTLKYWSMQTYMYSNDQLNWVANIALNFEDKEIPSDWAVIITGHYVGREGVWRATNLKDLVLAYKKGESYSVDYSDQYGSVNIDVDYTEQGEGDFISFFHGHRHLEEINDLDGLPVIGLLNSSPGQMTNVPGHTAPERDIDEENENAWYIIVINKDERKINIVGYGAANDNVIEY